VKAAFAGFLAGVVLVMAVALAIARHRGTTATPDPEPVVPAAASSSPGATAGDQDLAALRDRVAALREETARLAASLRAPAAAGDPRQKKPSRTRRDLGADLLKVFGPDGNADNGLYAKLRMELAVLAGDAADKEGVTATEGMLSPQVLEAVLLGLREACAESLAGPEAEALRSALDTYRRKWDSWKAEGKGGDGFERAAGLMEIQRDAREALFGATDPATTAKLRETMDEIDQYNEYCFLSNLNSETGDQPRALVANWVIDLGLDAAATAALRPVAEEYAREFERRAQQGGSPTGTQEIEDMRKALLLMARVRKRIREVASLTEEQAKKLAAWETVYAVPRWREGER
jgi:hypothetical protein